MFGAGLPTCAFDAPAYQTTVGRDLPSITPIVPPSVVALSLTSGSPAVVPTQTLDNLSSAPFTIDIKYNSQFPFTEGISTITATVTDNIAQIGTGQFDLIVNRECR